MSEVEDEESAPEASEEKKKSPVKAIIFSVAGAIVIGAAATGAAYFLTPGPQNCAPKSADADDDDAGRPVPADVTYVNLDPIIVTLGEAARSKYLKITISLETSKDSEKNLDELTPRIRDTLNSYLRAVDEDDLSRPAAMARLRAQMLRRLRLVAPRDKIWDVLITDFVLT
ncbi:MAG TPA: flagellar basal body-associated FliL family protein [Parvularculaceae bacterium]|nr:flagellar basal body-associated FliL family protein [Parvularculaceae bacterium]